MLAPLGRVLARETPTIYSAAASTAPARSFASGTDGPSEADAPAHESWRRIVLLITDCSE